MKVGETWIIKKKYYKVCTDSKSGKKPETRWKVKIKKIERLEERIVIYYKREDGSTALISSGIFLETYEKFYD